MLRGSSLLLTALFLGSTAAPFEHFRHEETHIVLPPGVVIPKVEVISDAKQSYALYLPSKYTREKRWPIVYVFDPLARGQLALEQFQHAAELYGYIVAASNNSRNGPWPPELEAANAVFRDTQERFSVDTARIYFAGFSGGARVSSQLAQICKCAAGVILSGAGFSFASQPSAEAKFAVFSTVGNADFNYSEVIPLQEKLEKATLAHWLQVFEGSHEWAPPSRSVDRATMSFWKSSLLPFSNGHWQSRSPLTCSPRGAHIGNSRRLLKRYVMFPPFARRPRS